MTTLSFLVQSILIFIVFIVAALLFFLPAGKKKQNLPFCLFLITICIHVLIDLTFETPIFNNYWFHILPGTFIFFYGPLLYFHSAEIIGLKVRKKWLHFLPFAASLVYYAFEGFNHAIFFPIFGIQYAVYVYLITKRVVRAKNTLKPIARTWILFVIYTFGLIWLFAFTANIFGAMDLSNQADTIELISYIISVLFFVGLIFFTMSQPGLFMNIRISKSNQTRPSNTLSEDERERMDLVKMLFEKEKIFTNSDLNREILAERLNIDTQQLSKEINQNFKMNLSELINRYRIEEAQSYLKDEGLNIKEVYYKVGFNSRSAFNTSFKKITGKTPSEYKKQQ